MREADLLLGLDGRVGRGLVLLEVLFFVRVDFVSGFFGVVLEFSVFLDVDFVAFPLGSLPDSEGLFLFLFPALFVVLDEELADVDSLLVRGVVVDRVHPDVSLRVLLLELVYSEVPYLETLARGPLSWFSLG